MADAELVDIAEDTTPDLTDVIYATNAAGTVDKRVPLASLPISTAEQAALDLKADKIDYEAVLASKVFG